MIAGRPFDWLEAIFLLLVVGSFYLTTMAVAFKFGVIAKAAWWLLAAVPLLLLLLWKGGPHGFYRTVRHEYRRLRHRVRMRTLANWG